MNVLFTSAGRRVELVRAFQRSPHCDRVVAADANRLAPALYAADRAIVVPRLRDPGYIPALVEVCEREEIDIVFPLIDPEIALLSRHRAEIEQSGAQVYVVDPTAAELTADKFATTQFFKDLGLTTPDTWRPEERVPADNGYPVFIKPCSGSASQHTFRVDDVHQYRFFAEYVPSPIVQEYLPGPEITTDVVCSGRGDVLGLVSRQRVEVRSGEVLKGVTIFDPKIADACLRIAEALPARGPITVQCMMRDGVPYFTEINARLGGGVPLAIAAGLDVPGLLLSHAGPDPIAPPQIGGYQVGMHLTRFDDSFFLSKANIDQVEDRRF